MTSFGTAVVVMRRYEKSGVPDELGEYTMVPVDVEAEGCRHRPLNFKEVVELNFDVATEYWKSTLPTMNYDDTVLEALAALKNTDTIEVDGQEYQIVGGVRPFDDLSGNPFKATIISQKQIG